MNALIQANENLMINLNGCILITYNPTEPVRSLILNYEADRSFNFPPCQARELWPMIESAALNDDDFLLVYSGDNAVIVNVAACSAFEWLGTMVKLRVGSRTYKIAGNIGRGIFEAARGVFEHA